MAASPYVELHAKSAFSFLEASSTPEQLAQQCAHYGQHAMALTDAHGVYGSARFHYAALRKPGRNRVISCILQTLIPQAMPRGKIPRVTCY